jgi:hypothetical protein
MISERTHRLAYALAVTGLLFTSLAQAQTQTQVYKWTDADGVTSYSQTPPAAGNARDVQAITIDTLPVEQQQAARRMVAHMEARANAQATVIQNRFNQADRNVSTALGNLQQAESALSAGSQTTGSDFIHNVGGGSRLRQSYFQRVTQLEANVQDAKAALDAAYTARNAAR